MSRWPQVILVIVVILIAGALRWAQIDLRPLHADEAVQAYQTRTWMEGGGYRYDPADKHGPFLYYFSGVFARAARWDASSLSHKQLRSLSLAAGLGLFALLASIGNHIGRRRTLVGLLLLAFAPLAILYQTYFVQEVWFALFSWAFLIAAYRGLQSPGLGWGLLLGLLAGLMQSCKETAPLHLFAILVALFASGVLKRERICERSSRLLGLLLSGAVAAALVYAAFFSSFGANPRGLLDGLSTYAHYSGRAFSSPHGQPWHAYLDIFMPHLNEGIWWSEILMLLCAAFGFVRVFRPKASRLLRASALFTGTLIFIYTLIPYKTPWLLLTPYAGLCLLAGSGIIELWDMLRGKTLRFAAPVLGVLSLVELGWRSTQALVHYAGDSRSPYFYQQTSPDFLNLLSYIETRFPASGDKEQSIAICSPDSAWPLPWYLRNRKRCAFFKDAPPPAGFDLVLLDSRLSADTLDYVGKSDNSARPFGLRPNVLLHAFENSRH